MILGLRLITLFFVLTFSHLTWAVNDTIPPVITLNPASNGSIECSCNNAPFIDPGAFALDNLEGDITSRMIVTGMVNTRLPGDYKITYSVSDTSKNSTTVERIVRVRYTKYGERNIPYFVNEQLLINTEYITACRWSYSWDLDGIPQSGFENKYTLVTNIQDSFPHVVCMNEKYCGYDTVFRICDTVNLKSVSRPRGIEGYFYRDVNKNCELDTNDIGLGFNEVGGFNNPCIHDDNDSTLGASYCRTFSNGAYFYPCKPGRHKLYLDSMTLDFFQLKTCNGRLDTTVNFDSSMRCVSGVNFGLNKPTPNLTVTWPWTLQRIFPGREFTLLCSVYDQLQGYRNKHDSDVGGQVKIKFSGPVKYVKESKEAMQIDSIKSNTIFYTVKNFNDSVFNAGFNVVFLTDSTAQKDSSVCFELEVLPAQADAVPSDNKKISYGSVSNSYDPNFKSVFPLSAVPNHSEWLTYTVHFQNTGNAAANRVLIRDTLDVQFYLDSFVVLGSSHKMVTSKNASALAFLFSDINLIDSATDAELSQGFVVYKVKLKDNLPNESLVKNTAYIFFDFNVPVITNTSCFPILDPKLSMVKYLKSGLAIYPNPNTGGFYLNSPSADFQLEIKNYLGQDIAFESEKISTQTYSIKGLNPGIYSVRYKHNGLDLFELLIVQ